MQRRLTDARAKLIEKIVAAARERMPAELPGDVDDVIRQYYRHVSAEDLAHRDAADLAGAALAHLKFAAKRKADKPLVRLYNPSPESHGFESPHTIVEMINDDMPFLVDSLSMVLMRHGLAIHLTIHPVLTIRRDKQGRLLEILALNEAADDAITESYISVEVNRETSPEALAAVRDGIRTALDDVRAAVNDWPPMRERIRRICEELERHPPPLPSLDVQESKALLEWMEDHHFTFLGYREYRLVRSKETYRLEPLAESGLGILRGTPRPPQAPTEAISAEIRRQARSKDLLIITKANSQATVHRPGYLDYVGVKQFDDDGKVIGERRFLGLWTSVAYSRSPRDIPLLRHKVQKVIAHFKLPQYSHDAKALTHILETFPRDELFQSSIEDLIRIAGGIFGLQERNRVRLFVRRDAFRRFFSCLVYVPRDKYNTQIRERIEEILLESFGGDSVDSNVQLSESSLARVHIIVRTSRAVPARPKISNVEQRIVDAVRTWLDELRDVLIERAGEERGLKLHRRYHEAFPAAYREDVSPREASFDIERMETLSEDTRALKMSLYRPGHYPPSRLRFKLFHRMEPLSISDVLPILENMGLRVISERPYSVHIEDEPVIWVQDFEMEYPGGQTLDLRETADGFQDTFANIWAGEAENDGFNRLVLAARLSWRQTAMLRAYCRYLLQTGIPFSQPYMEQVLNRNSTITQLLVDLFTARFDPARGASDRTVEAIDAWLDEALDAVTSLDEDRIVHAYRSVIQATLRTNFYQTDVDGRPKAHISFKLDPRKIPDLPLPRPKFEVFVYSPRVEGVHLRMGPVARGGLRWSDRREDFRTEILGLMKAQNVKNTLIVPVGAKGGFVTKRLPEGSRDEIQAEVLYCYRTFIRGLLDITDNIVDGRIVQPPAVIRHDGDDAYLVVAADKGTATFSDIANEVAASYGFWLGDAFASGGSAGYDHKKMGITARGGWEAVKRHFREIGIDIQSHNFSVAGIGDMSGDVFGNGMLLSRHIRLKAAFNHQHIFLDPEPDPVDSYQERQRLFALPRSGWDDYDRALISQGGGIYSRQSKSIALSAEVKAMLGVGQDSLTPQELIRAILRMPVDLLWNGGIGTYVKSSQESNAEVGDRANDNVRVDADELRCQVIGEGGNLGLTQLGRIEFALHGGRLNTDFIDNSAGVDTSDHEVNIKILLNLVAQQRPLTLARRNRLLEAMTAEVAELVLRDNYLQTQAISMMETHAVERINEHAHLLQALERNTDLNRALEGLPNAEDIGERRKSGKGFTRPELAVLLSYSKIALYSALLRSNVPEDPYLRLELRRYFPAPLQRRYEDLMSAHPLSREIIATAITNSLINRMGPVFALRTQEETGADPAAIARAYTIAREVFEARSLWSEIEALDTQVHANVQYSMMFQTTRLLRHSTYWFLAHHHGVLEIEAAVSALRPGVQRLVKRLPTLLVGTELERFDEAAQLYHDIGVPEGVARRMAGLTSMYAALDIVEQARLSDEDVEFVAGVYFELGRGLKLDWIRDQIEALKVDGHWQAVARGSMRDNLFVLHRTLTAQLIEQYRGETPADTVVAWLEQQADRVNYAKRTLAEMKSAGSMDFPTLSVALQAIRKLEEAGRRIAKLDH